MNRWALMALALGLVLSVRAASGPPIPVRPESKMIPDRVVGTPSCSARACHGGDSPLAEKKIGRHEYSAWNYADPHTQSLAVLFNDRSKQIKARMQLTREAYEEPRCLACHAERSGPDGVGELTSVGCESCHGSAWLWLDPHTAGDGWRAKFPEAAKTLLDAGNLTAVARSCVGCHIGAPPDAGIGVRDMNHDMIAAGHPRLNFEFAGYLAQLPPHWNEKARPRDAIFYAKAWTLGQAVSAEAALNLLEYRAQQPVWPELAEYACYACHHNLQVDRRWRQEPPVESKGKLLHGSWYMPALKVLDVEGLTPAVDSFEQSMSARPTGELASKAAATLKSIVTTAIEKGISADASVRNRVVEQLNPLALRDWDYAAQVYLALAALSPDAEWQKLAPLMELLRRPAEFRKSTEFDAQLRALTER
jgi:hypothetical protein